MTRLDPERQSWMRTPEARAAMKALGAEQGRARFVGGAVRNALLGCDVDDIDIATVHKPDEVVVLLESAGIKAVPTGIAHGTVTAVFPAHAFEITTLRKDVTTDGRHAWVVFSDDWRLDAQRRDFTINALYAAPDGEMFDYTGGLRDIEARRIRFIGDPVARIREDYLRILRLFRFHAWYGSGEIDAAALAAARDERAGLQRLSGERIRNELFRLLDASDPVPVVRAMNDSDILREILGDDCRVVRMEQLVRIDAANSFPADPVLRLAALLPSDGARASATAERLRLSSGARNRLVDFAEANEALEIPLSLRELRVLLYRLGTQKVRDRIRLRWAEKSHSSRWPDWRATLAFADSWSPPKFPISGKDVIAANIPEGPGVGALLGELERWWMSNDFAPDRAALLERLKATTPRGGVFPPRP